LDRYSLDNKLFIGQQAIHWTAEEIDFSKDKNDWIKLDDNILAFFAGSDGIVGLNIMNNFCKRS
jgi:ribonucleoside-diphosphate reductase subunit M2